MEDKLIEVWRAEFEGGMKLNYPKVSLFRSGDRYFGAIAEGAYIGFLMAKQSQKVVELPERHFYPDDMDKFFWCDEVIAALTAAGIQYTVKE